MTQSVASKTARLLRGLVCEMLIKGITLFLVFMAILAMFGKIKYPGKKLVDARKCQRCGRFKIGKGTCECSKG